MKDQDKRPAYLEAICQVLDDKQGVNIRVLDVRGVSGVADFFVIVTGTSPPHIKALFNAVQHAMKKDEGQPSFRRSGLAEGGWMVLDYVDVVIHIFSEDARRYYALEALWADAPRPAE